MPLQGFCLLPTARPCCQVKHVVTCGGKPASRCKPGYQLLLIRVYLLYPLPALTWTMRASPLFACRTCLLAAARKGVMCW